LPPDAYWARLAIRLYALVHLGLGLDSSDGHRSLLDIEVVSDDFYSFPENRDSLKQFKEQIEACKNITKFTMLKKEMSMDELFGKLVRNVFEVKDYCSCGVTGYGLYLNLSRIEHSCDANAQTSFSGTLLHIVPNDALSFDHEVSYGQVAIHYVLCAGEEKVSSRQRALTYCFGIRCACRHCTDESDKHEALVDGQRDACAQWWDESRSFAERKQCVSANLALTTELHGQYSRLNLTVLMVMVAGDLSTPSSSRQAALRMRGILKHCRIGSTHKAYIRWRLNKMKGKLTADGGHINPCRVCTVLAWEIVMHAVWR
jgi:hypothetical protein